MDTADIWQCLCEKMTVREILENACLSKRHYKVSKMMAKMKSIHIDNDEALRQIFDWVINSLDLRAMISETTNTRYDEVMGKINLNEENNESEDEEEKIDEGPFHYDFHKVGYWSFNDYACELDREVEQLIPSHIGLEDIMYLEYDLTLFNQMGINDDSRGVIFDIEREDYNEMWHWEKGFMTVRRFAEGIFRLKSHKFENWYERFYGVNPHGTRAKHLQDLDYKNDTILTTIDNVLTFRAEVAGDHGS